MCRDLFSCCFGTGNSLGLPRQYEFMSHLGEGGFGLVVRCKKKDTKEIVAVKICGNSNTMREVHIMRKLMSHNLHQHNIVRFLGSFSTASGFALVMEELDINLLEYLRMLKGDLMPLSDIRSIIQQLAVALDALKSIGVIHGDIKQNNVMMVDHQTRPLRVKLIDFGLALFTSETKLGMLLQHHLFRAPEVTLGLPFTEAIDMWSLGCMLAIMFTGSPLFRGWTDSAIMQCIVYHCGQPPDHLLNEGLCTERYFCRTETNGWKLKKCLRRNNLNRYYEDQIKEDRLDNKNEAEALQARQCLDLLRAMLRVDPAERITPAEVLVHPFIVEASVSAPDDRTNIERDHRLLSKIPLSRYLPVEPAAAENALRLEDQGDTDSLEIHLSTTSGSVSWTSTSDSQDSATPPKERQTTNIQPAHCSPSPTVPPSREIYVRPATAENTLCLEYQESLDSLVIHESKTSRPVSWTSISDREDPVTTPEERETTNIQPAHRSPSPTIPPSRVIYVRPATAENTHCLEDQEDTDSLVIHVSKMSRPVSWTSTSDREDPVTALEERETTNPQPTPHSPSPTIPRSRVIYVRPATAENTHCLEDQEDTDSLVIDISKTSRPVSWTSTSDREDPVTTPEERETTDIQPAHRSPSPTIPPSRVIHVQPATAENTHCLEDQEDTDSLQAGLKNTSESPVTITENDTTLTEDDSTVTDSDSTVTFNDFTAIESDSTFTTSDTTFTTSDTSTLTSEDFTYYGKKQLPQSPPPVTDLSSKKKKKKNCFRRFFSWMKKTFCSCVTCVDDD